MNWDENKDPNDVNENGTPEQKPDIDLTGEFQEKQEYSGKSEKENQKEHFRDREFDSAVYYKKPEKKSHGMLAVLIVLCLAVFVLGGIVLNDFLFSKPGPTESGLNEPTLPTIETSTVDTPAATTGSTETAPGVQFGDEIEMHSALARVANECIQSVVVINVTESAVSYGQEYTTSGAGSGVIYTEDGYIVTNYHVVGSTTKSISVTLYDGSTHEARFIYGDEYADISVIKIEKNDCKPAKIGDSRNMLLGDAVLAIGNPLGYGLSVTDGIVSALERSVTIENTTMTLMQTSAAINNGNSGGGLFNARGELIGIVNAKIGGTTVEGMGFAIPSSTVVKCINDLKEYGYITGKARLGVTVKTQQYQTWPYMQVYTFIQVSEISENGSAAKSGLKVDDILQKFNGAEITSFATLSQQLTKYSVGDTVTLTVRRPTIERTSNNLQEYLNSCQEIEIKITFVEFNPNQS